MGLWAQCHHLYNWYSKPCQTRLPKDTRSRVAVSGKGSVNCRALYEANGWCPQLLLSDVGMKIPLPPSSLEQ